MCFWNFLMSAKMLNKVAVVCVPAQLEGTEPWACSTGSPRKRVPARQTGAPAPGSGCVVTNAVSAARWWTLA